MQVVSNSNFTDCNVNIRVKGCVCITNMINLIMLNKLLCKHNNTQ